MYTDVDDAVIVCEAAKTIPLELMTTPKSKAMAARAVWVNDNLFIAVVTISSVG